MRYRRGILAVATALALTSGTAAVAAPYPPPSDGQGTVDPSRIKAGQCTTFSGNGFLPETTISYSDNGAARDTSSAGLDGSFSHKMCFPDSTKPGKHVLRATGTGSDASPRTVSGDLTVQGVSQTHGSNSNSSGSGKAQTSLPAADAGSTSTRNAAFSGTPLLTGGLLVLILVGGLAWTLVVSEVRHRRQRRQS